MTFRVAISGLNAAQSELAATANNIANSSTTGFKSSRVQFAELYSGSGGGQAAVGSGVKVAGVNQRSCFLPQRISKMVLTGAP